MTDRTVECHYCRQQVLAVEGCNAVQARECSNMIQGGHSATRDEREVIFPAEDYRD